MRLPAAVLSVCIAGVPLVAVASHGLAPGRWQSQGVVTMAEMPGMPPEALAMMKRRPISHTYCLSAEEAESGARGLFSEGNGSCRYTKFAMVGGRLNAVMQCKGPQGDMQMTMLGTYTRTSYEATNVMVMGGPQGAMRMTTRVSGKHIGDC